MNFETLKTIFEKKPTETNAIQLLEQTDEQTDVQLVVKNPYTGKETNLLPLFELMNRQTHVTTSGANNLLTYSHP